jgi:DNA-binding Lrp family transcriptional regulator
MGLDGLDKEILQELEIDSRQSNSTIAHKLKTNKTIIGYRIERLKNNEIIQGFQYITNQAALGELSFGLLIQLENASFEEEEKIIEKIKKSTRASWISSINGHWDIIVVFIKKDFNSFIEELNKLFNLIGDKVKKYNLYVDYEGEIFNHKYIYQNLKSSPVKYGSANEPVNLKETEIKVHQLLKENPKISLLDIAHKLNKTYDTIKSKYTFLKSKKILLKCSPKINISRLGYQEYFFLLNLKPNQKRINDLLGFCSANKNIIRYSRCLGHFDVILNVHAKNSEEVKKITYEIRKEYSDILTSLETMQTVLK